MEEERAYLKRQMGYNTTGFTREQAFFIWQGPGQDGKSTILDACRETLGSYAAAGSILSFLDVGPRGGGDHSTDIAALAGDVRLVVLSEPPRGAKLNAGLLKAWTSGSPIMARELREKPFTFRPVGKLVIECNPLPDPKGDDDGIWRRIKLSLFRKKVPDDKVDKTLPDKLRGEASGILNWLLEGVEDWLVGDGGAGGLRFPASLQQVVADYRKTSSPISDWLMQRCVYGEAAAGERTLAGELYKDFKDWFDAQGFEKPPSARSFGDALRDRQILLAGKNGAGLKYRGPVRLKRADELAADAAADDATSDGSGAGGPVGSGTLPREPGDDLDEPWGGE
jgi:putative DNA primase/helicase